MSLETHAKLRAVFGGLVIGGATIAAALVGRPRKKRWFGARQRRMRPLSLALHALSAASGARVFAAPPSPERTRALAMWGTQLVLNGAWSHLFYTRNMPRLALANATALLEAMRAYRTQASKVAPLAGALVLPCVAWIGFAKALNERALERRANA